MAILDDIPGLPHVNGLVFTESHDLLLGMRTSPASPVLMLMVDGLGLPPEGLAASVYARWCPQEFLRLLGKAARVDTSMGVPGTPQSATGQTALFTGVNAARHLGMHMQGFPGPSLRRVIEQSSLFSRLRQAGREAAFANAYVRFSLEELTRLRLRSVTTVMTQAALGTVRGMCELLIGRAVYHDLTHRTLAGEAGIPPCTPREAARRLMTLALNHDFTLFEYFLTDRFGHRRDEAGLAGVLAELAEFVCELAEMTTDRCILVLTSDHGNCEDLSTRGHTLNPVPLLVHGPTSGLVLPTRIEDICPFVEQALCGLEGTLPGPVNA